MGTGAAGKGGSRRSDMVNDPNPVDDPQYIVLLFGKAVSVNVETMVIVSGGPGGLRFQCAFR